MAERKRLPAGNFAPRKITVAHGARSLPVTILHWLGGSHEWTAHDMTKPYGGKIGLGDTEDAAIADLLTKLGEH